MGVTCEIILSTAILLQTCSGISWSELSKLNDPPGRPSVRAAKVATQGMSRAEMIRKLAQFRLALAKDKSAEPESRSVLKREAALIQVALENL